MRRLALVLGALGTAAAPARADLQRLSLSHIQITQGSLQELGGGRFLVATDRLRAVVRTPGQRQVELRFTYLGPTPQSTPLESGQLRRQIGLKLLAQDPCNVLYVMWRIEPEARLSVQLKRNPGLRRSALCRAGGYETLQPHRARDVPAPLPGSQHTLRAELDDHVLRVLADGMPVWEGRLDSRRLPPQGPAGLRSDNGRFEIEWLVDRR
ncbi:MAG: hypothetical protein RMK29_08865 [Myxococcales bacterium]|nr:hypothetical protein [Myxococcota bacterium]MDW8281808.1 hypothetical protein [Myxococcales bacterium]